MSSTIEYVLTSGENFSRILALLNEILLSSGISSPEPDCALAEVVGAAVVLSFAANAETGTKVINISVKQNNSDNSFFIIIAIAFQTTNSLLKIAECSALSEQA